MPGMKEWGSGCGILLLMLECVSLMPTARFCAQNLIAPCQGCPKYFVPSCFISSLGEVLLSYVAKMGNTKETTRGNTGRETQETSVLVDRRTADSQLTLSLEYTVPYRDKP